MTSSEHSDIHWMNAAIELARSAGSVNEVPVGAVLVRRGEIIGEGWNQPISSCDPTAHAEIIVLRNAASRLENYRLVDTTLYVTVEPCSMCAGAMIHARIARLVFGTREPRSGAVVSTERLLDNPGLNHKIEITEGVCKEICSSLLKDFFASRR